MPDPRRAAARLRRLAHILAWVLAVAAMGAGPAGGRADPAAGPSARTAAGEARVDITGPATVTVRRCCVPPKEPYTFAVTYLGAIPAGPPGGPPGLVQARFTMTLPTHLHSMEIEGGAGMSAFELSTGPRTFWGPEWSVYTGTLFFQEAARTVTIRTMIRPSGLDGAGTVLAELDTGDRATLTTTFVRESAPSPPPPPPAVAPTPVAGPPAAPTKTVVETFTQPGEAEPQAVRIVPSARTTQVALTWPEADSSFDVTGLRIVRDGQVVARAPQSVTAKVRPGKLRVSKRRTARSLDVRIKGLKAGRLTFKIVARRLDGRTRVVARVRQSRRG